MTDVSVVAELIPYLGLRYFEEHDSELFFGRDEQLRDVLVKLADSRFVTVIGNSGTGKSSLVRAAVLPAVRQGFVREAGSSWRIAKTSPGQAPIHNLAIALKKCLETGALEVTLRRGSLGLIDAAQQGGLTRGENLLIIVDQFEEIFRYQNQPGDSSAAGEASSFVQLLLQSTLRSTPSIRVILTMRSEYLGACARFRDLPERINDGLYLVPRMDRDQLEEAITGPAAVAGAVFAPPLVQRLLNDAGEDPDQLPVLQHALLRTWLNWKQAGRPADPISFEHYQATGGVRDGLDTHAEEIYKSLSEAEKNIAEVIFRSLTERDESNNDIRRPTPLRDIAAIAGVTVEEVARVADAFRRPDVSFINPAFPEPLRAETRLDIAHESLIRKWYRLGNAATGDRRPAKSWVQAEAEVRDHYRDLVKRARKAQRTGEVLTGSDLAAAQEWHAMELPEAWGRRYEPAADGFGLVTDYIGRSVAAEKRRAARSAFGWGVAALVVAIVAVLFALFLQANAASKREATLREQSDAYRALATARGLATSSSALTERDTRPEVSALLAVQALDEAPVPEAILALRAPMAVLHPPRWVKDSTRPRSAAVTPEQEDFEDFIPSRLRFSPDGEYLAQSSSGTGLRLYRAADGGEVALSAGSWRPFDIAWRDFASGPELYILVREGITGGDVFAVVYSLQVAGRSARPIAKVPCGFDYDCRAMLSPDGKYLAVSFRQEPDTLYPLPSGPHRKLSTVGEIEAIGANGPTILLRVDREKSAEYRWIGPKLNRALTVTSDGELPAISANSDILAMVDSNRVVVYRRTPAFAQTGSLSVPAGMSSLELSDDGKLLAVADNDGDVRLYEWSSRKRLAALSHVSPVTAMAFSPDGNWLASLDDGTGMKVVPTRTARPPGVWQDVVPLAIDMQPQSQFSAFYDPSGRLITVRNLREHQIFDAEKGLGLLRAERSFVSALSPDGSYAAFPDGPAIYLTSLPSSSVTDSHVLAYGRPSSVALSPEARYVAFHSRDTTRVLDRTDSSFVALPPEVATDMRPLLFSPDGKWLTLFRRQDSTTDLVLVPSDSWTPAKRWESLLRPAPAFSADGKFLLVRRWSQHTTSGSGVLVDLRTLSERALRMPDSAPILATRFAPTGNRLAVSYRDGQEHFVDVFDPQGDSATAHFSVDLTPSLLTLSQAGKYVAVGSREGVAQVFDIESKREVSRAGLTAGEQLRGIRFSEGDRVLDLLYIAEHISEDSAPEVGVRRQYLFSEELRPLACARIGRSMTTNEWKKYRPDTTYRKTC